MEFRWHKRRWWCREPGCPRRSFTEQIPQIPAGARVTMPPAGRGRPPRARDRWHTGFVDALGTDGLLGQVEGRSVADVLAWFATTPLTWRKSIRHVAIDMSAT